MYQIDSSQLHDVVVTATGTNCIVWQQRVGVPELLANLDMWANPEDHSLSVDGQPPLTVGFWLATVTLVSQPANMPMLISAEELPSEK